MKLEHILTIEEIVEEFGDLSAVGETNIDNKRYEELKDVGNLIEQLLWKVIEASKDKGRPEYSMNLQGELACNILDEVRGLLGAEEGKQIINEDAISYLYENHFEVYEEFYKRL